MKIIVTLFFKQQEGGVFVSLVCVFVMFHIKGSKANCKSNKSLTISFIYSLPQSLKNNCNAFFETAGGGRFCHNSLEVCVCNVSNKGL